MTVPRADRLATGPLPIDEALKLSCQIADALEATHEKAITHRDLKPANIKITGRGVVKVLDFGIAQEQISLDSETMTHDRLTAVGDIVGTPGYMSPEHVRGQAVDPHSNQFSIAGPGQSGRACVSR